MSFLRDILRNGKKIHFTDQLTFYQRFITFLGELVATAILMFVGCMGGVQGITASKTIPAEQQCWSFGIAVLIAIQVFGHVSGAHLNPAVSLTSYILGNISLIQTINYFVAQFLGALGGFGILVLVTPPEAMGNHRMNDTHKNPGACSPAIHPRLTIWQGFLVEFMNSLILVLICCGVWDRRNVLRQDSTAIRFGIAIAGLAMTAGPYTTNQINPVRSFAPALFNGDWSHHWLFWTAPLSAAFLGAFFYKFIFEQPREIDSEELKVLD